VYTHGLFRISTNVTSRVLPVHPLFLVPSLFFRMPLPLNHSLSLFICSPRYGTSGTNSSACSGPCSPGYSCPAGSTNATAVICPAGSYSVAAAAMCTPCPGGRYGSSLAMSVAACSGACTAGYACPAGSTNATTSICPAGKYSEAASPWCSPCVAGFYGATAGLTAFSCSGARAT
jgi:hypothetical protein